MRGEGEEWRREEGEEWRSGGGEGRTSLLFYLSRSFFRRTWDRECELKLTFFVWLHQKGFVILYLGGNEINKKKRKKGKGRDTSKYEAGCTIVYGTPDFSKCSIIL